MTQPFQTRESTPGNSPAESATGHRRNPAAQEAEDNRTPRGFHRRITAVRHVLIGAAMSQALLTSILALGWVQRACRTVVLRQWQRMATPSRRAPEPWPSWFHASPAHSQTRWKGIVTGFRETGGTVRAGLQALVCLCAATLPGCLLWAFAWYDGWQNSFAKGYEHALVGPALFTVGTVLFVIAMLYVPIAQARLAATGAWKGFFDVRTVWTLIRQRWGANLGIALVCTGLNLPVSILKTFPAFQAQAIENQLRASKASGKAVPPSLVHPADLTPSEQLRFLQRYFLFSGLYVFPAFALVHFLAARTYASALVKAVRRQSLSNDTLTPWELSQLSSLQLLPETSESHERPMPSVRWPRTQNWLHRFAVAATCCVWLTFMAQIVVSEFLKYTAWGRGWWNQPLIQLPWFNYVPAALEAAADATPASENATLEKQTQPPAQGK